MEFYEVKKINDWYFKIKLPYVDRRRVKYSQKTYKYIYSIHRNVTAYETEYLFDEELEDGEFKFQIGYAAFIYNEFYDDMNQESRDLLDSFIYENHELPIFDNLREDQNEDLKSLLLYKRGIFQTYTSYGKSEIISTLANYIANTLGEYVLILTPDSTSLNEIKFRLKDKFQVELDYMNLESKINAININGYLRSYSYNPKDEFWKNNFWILADEVERCVTDTCMDFYERLQVKCMYGFSATADKSQADPLYSRVSDEFLYNPEITRLLDRNSVYFDRVEYSNKINEEKSRVRDILGRNKILVGYYGNSVVYRKPTKFNITMVDIVSTISADDLEIPEDYNYNEIIYNLFTDKRMCALIEAIAFKVGLVFIPMFRLEVIDYWLDNYFKKKDFLVLVISGRGYELYENGEYLGDISIEEMKRLVDLNIIGCILGTKSSYGALDLPKLNKSILLYSKVANVVIQAIGRTARSSNFEIYMINSMKTIPTYSKDFDERKSLIKAYYRDCKIIEIKRSENLYI